MPHAKASTGVDRKTITIAIVQTSNWETLRKGFVSKSLYQPDYKLTNNNQYFGIISKGNQFAELHIYDYQNATLEYRMELSHRMFEKSEGRLTITDDRSRFIFLPDNESALLTMGNRLIKWNFTE